MVKSFVEKVAKDLYLLRVDDEEVKHFEAFWCIPEGITYNAYLLLTDAGAVLFDSWKERYAEEFIEVLKDLVDLKELKYVVVHHMEPDHSGALPMLFKIEEVDATVLGHPLVNGMLKSFYGIGPKFKSVKDGEELTIGDKTLRFVHTPWLHWPETIMTYLVDDKVLLSGDAFGGFSTPKGLFDEGEDIVSNYLPWVRKYVATIIGFYREYIVKNVKKLEGVDIRLIAPAHGLLWKSPKTIIDYYLDLANAKPVKGKVLVLYASMYGSVEKAVSIAVDELSKLSCKPVVFRFTDEHHDNIGDAVGEAIDSEAFLIASPTYENDVFPEVKFFVELLVRKVCSPKPVLILSSLKCFQTRVSKSSML